MRKSIAAVAIALSLVVNANAAQAGELVQSLCRPIKFACQSGGVIEPWMIAAAQAFIGAPMHPNILCMLVEKLCPEESNKMGFAKLTIRRELF